MDAARPDSVTTDPAARLRGAGLRVTAQRVSILRALAALGGHRTADEIGSALAGAGEGIPRATLYHALGAMAESGAILVADAGPGTARYEVGSDAHHHLVCRGCGAVVDIPCGNPTPGSGRHGRGPCIDPVIPGVRIDEAQVIYRGLCRDCVQN